MCVRYTVNHQYIYLLPDTVLLVQESDSPCFRYPVRLTQGSMVFLIGMIVINVREMEGNARTQNQY